MDILLFLIFGVPFGWLVMWFICTLLVGGE